MAALHKLSITNLRNITQADIQLAPRFNVFIGENGSGKSTILEAVYLLGLARSFRGNHQKPLIQDGQNECTAFSELEDASSVGITRLLRGAPQIKLSGSKVKNMAELAANLPLQLLNSDSFSILEGSPKFRREYIDWGVFHVEHDFIGQWRKTRRALQNRNNLLKNKALASEILPWSREFAQHSAYVDGFRDNYVQQLMPVLNDILSQLISIDGLSIEYYRGWDTSKDLLELLQAGLPRDLKYGYTVQGPQRAELAIKVGKHNAVEVLSRGQQKLLVSALKISQGLLLEQLSGKQCVYLVDDLPSELDGSNRAKVCRLLHKLKVQAFITCVDQEALRGCMIEEGVKVEENKLFHVKHGKIEEFATVP